jgi:hypothetical protein
MCGKALPFRKPYFPFIHARLRLAERGRSPKANQDKHAGRPEAFRTSGGIAEDQSVKGDPMYKPKPHRECEMLASSGLVKSAFHLADDREKRLRNHATKNMCKNMPRNLVYYAQLLKQHPLTMKG